MRGWHLWQKNGATGCFKTVQSTCGDFRDSIFLPFIDKHLQPGSTSLTFGINDAFYPVWPTDVTVDYYKSFPTYDSIASYAYLYYYQDNFYESGIFMKLNKTRDTIWADISKMNWLPVFKRLDTCKIVMVRVL